MGSLNSTWEPSPAADDAPEPLTSTDLSGRQQRSDTPSPKALVEHFPRGKGFPFGPYTTPGGAGDVFPPQGAGLSRTVNPLVM